MNIVPDANIYISAFLWGGNPGKVLQRALDGKDDLYITKDILDEIQDVLFRPKFHLDEMQIDYYVKLIEGIANRVIPKMKIENVCRDVDDNKYIECALESEVNYIISGDTDLLVLKEYNRIKIITAKEYLEIVT
jgi:putative PIN family toxin of toxin-antitoxin system